MVVFFFLWIYAHLYDNLVGQKLISDINNAIAADFGF